MTEHSPITALALLCDSDGIITRVIQAPSWLGNALQVGMPFSRIVAPGNLAKALSFLVELRGQGIAFDWEINLACNAQTKTLHFTGGKAGESILIVGSENGKMALQLFEEMTRISNEQTNTLRAIWKQARRDDSLYDEISRLNNELVGMQRELAKKNAELERLNDEKNRFLGMAAHDLRNPLHAILSYSAFLIDEFPGFSEEERREFTAEIHAASRFMAALVDDLLDVAKIEAGQLQLEYDPLNLLQLVQHNVNRNRLLAARKQINISLQAEQVPSVVADGAKLEQVLNNLIGNAVKFSPPGSQVEVRIKHQPPHFLLEVADQGIGMTPEDQEKLFKPFQRGQKGTQGEKSTGLGMVIVKRIIEGHGGKIGVSSTPGQGTTISLSIPLTPPHLENQEK
jgi:signal transduction histidine kinase